MGDLTDEELNTLEFIGRGVGESAQTLRGHIAKGAAEIRRHRAARKADKERVRTVVIEVVSDVLANNRAPTTTEDEMRIAGIVLGSAVAARVAEQLSALPGLSDDVVRGLQLMRGHLDDGGHDWRTGTAMADVQAAREWLDRLLGAKP